MRVPAEKEQAVRRALDARPRQQGETLSAYSRRIGGAVGVSASYVHLTITTRRYEALGQALRAQEAEEVKTACQVVRPGLEVGPVRNFNGWVDTFTRFKVLAEAYLNLAQARGDVYASAFLRDIRDSADKAQSRAARSLAA